LQAREEASSPIVRFRTDDGARWGFIFHHLEYTRFERDTLLLEWSIGTIRIRGPKAEIFFDKFANHQATSVSADGKDIESVTMRLKTDGAVEEEFAAIEKLTDADLNRGSFFTGSLLPNSLSPVADDLERLRSEGADWAQRYPADRPVRTSDTANEDKTVPASTSCCLLILSLTAQRR
jgi:hypothetical protein